MQINDDDDDDDFRSQLFSGLRRPGGPWWLVPGRSSSRVSGAVGRGSRFPRPGTGRPASCTEAAARTCNVQCTTALGSHQQQQPQPAAYKSSLTNFQDMSRIHFFKSRRFLPVKPYNIKMQENFVMSGDLLFLSFNWQRRRRLFFFLPRAKDELHPLFSSPLPLEVGPLNTARRSGERCKLPPVGYGAKPQPTNDLVHIGVKKCSSGGSSFCWFS